MPYMMDNPKIPTAFRSCRERLFRKFAMDAFFLLAFFIYKSNFLRNIAIETDTPHTAHTLYKGAVRIDAIVDFQNLVGQQLNREKLRQRRCSHFSLTIRDAD